MMTDFYAKVKPVIDRNMRKLCVRPYPLHKKGCPNFNRKEGCPPNCKDIDEILDFKKNIYVIYNKYHFGKHKARMRRLHPNWSKRQVECCLYWQGTARKQLKDKIKVFLHLFPRSTIVACPEASGTNLTATMEQIGIKLEWPPVKYTYQIVLAGIARK